METFEEHWDDVERFFNFDKVYQVMKLIDWTWGQGENASIPSKAKIKARAKELCKSAYDEKSNISSGGLEAYYEDGMLQLAFVLEKWETS